MHYFLKKTLDKPVVGGKVAERRLIAAARRTGLDTLGGIC